MFSPDEKELLMSLKENPVWQSILEKLGRFHRDIPAYKPNTGDVDVQVADWKYFSGVDRGRQDLLKQLRYE